MRRLLLAALFSLVACRGSDPGQIPQAHATVPGPVASSAAPAVTPVRATERRRDLSLDESMGGHTLARHVARTDAQLAGRLRDEPQISAASTWSDRQTAEHAVAEALDTAGGRLTSWEHRSGRRPNLVLRYTDRSGTTLGRSLARGARTSVPCTQALVVLRWDERRDRFYVLTAYPEAER